MKKTLTLASFILLGTLGACGDDETAYDVNENGYTNVANENHVTNDYYRRVANDANTTNYNYGYYGPKYHTKANEDDHFYTTINDLDNNIKGIDKIRAIAYDNNVVVSVIKEADVEENVIEEQIREKLKPLVGERDINIYFGTEQYNKLDDINNEINDGQDVDLMEEMRESMDELEDNVREGIDNIQDSELDIYPNGK